MTLYNFHGACHSGFGCRTDRSGLRNVRAVDDELGSDDGVEGMVPFGGASPLANVVFCFFRFARAVLDVLCCMRLLSAGGSSRTLRYSFLRRVERAMRSESG